MVNVRPFSPDDVALLNAPIDAFWTPGYVRQLMAQPAISIVADMPIACAGIARTATHSGMLWSILSPASAPHMLALTRIARRFLAASCLTRIEATAVAGFDPGCRWLELIGFTKETPKPMRHYSPDGKDHYLYAWVR